MANTAEVLELFNQGIVNEFTMTSEEYGDYWYSRVSKKDDGSLWHHYGLKYNNYLKYFCIVDE